VLVTGGGGFLGGAVCARLVQAGHEVRRLSRRPLPGAGAVLLGDLRTAGDVAAAVAGCDAVVHCAAKAGYWGSRAEFYDTNVRGTEHVVDACLRHGVDRLVYTSSPSVVHSGTDLAGVDESVPYATHFCSPYPETKAIAEALVLSASSSRLATVALRPHLVWGPGDPHFVPRLVARARQGRLRLIGTGEKQVDTVYVDNAADAHRSALERLAPGAPIAGRAYFITQGEPRSVRETIAMWLDAAGLPAENREIPERPARVLAGALERVWRLGRIPGEPPLTRFLVEQLSTAHWFDLTAARRDLDYSPRISTEHGLQLLRAGLSAGTGAAAGTETHVVPPTVAKER
jgi:nucleoside-diphosphate-sugar epimerase